MQAAISCVSHTIALTDGTNIWLAENPTALTALDTVSLEVQEELHESAVPLERKRYNYTLTDLHGQEIVAYHRHGGRHTYDHFHTSFGPLAGHAVPSGEVRLADVIRYCISEHAVIAVRADWQDALAGL
jgi:hypothetical protein